MVALKLEWPDIAMVASVVPCQLPMNEMMRRLPVARSTRRWAASDASDPEKAEPDLLWRGKAASEALGQFARLLIDRRGQNRRLRAIKLVDNCVAHDPITVPKSGQRPK